MYEQRNTCVLKKHHADYRDRGYWGTTKTRNIKIQRYIALRCGSGDAMSYLVHMMW